MFNQISHKNKIIALSVLVIILLITAKKRSFDITYRAYNQVKELKQKLKYMTDSSLDSKSLSGRVAFLDSYIKNTNTAPEFIQRSILSFAGKHTAIEISNMQPVHIIDDKGFKIITNQLTISGGFNELTSVYNNFERNFKDSRIMSFTYSKDDNSINKNKLYLSLIFQNYVKTN